MNCPCCGQIVTETTIEMLRDVPLATVPRTIVNALINAYPRAVTAGFLIQSIYNGSREPETALTGIHVQMHRIREKLSEYGWTVSKQKPGRGNVSQYRLEAITHD